MTDYSYYAIRALIIQADPTLYGHKAKDQWTLPAEFEALCDHFPVIRGDKYYLITFGITREKEEHVVGMTSGNSLKRMVAMAQKYPLTIVRPWQMVIGKLAPRYGMWKIQVLLSGYHGKRHFYNPRWRVISRGIGTYKGMKAMLHALQQEELRKNRAARKVYRMVPYTEVPYKWNRRKYFLWDYYEQEKEQLAFSSYVKAKKKENPPPDSAAESW